MAKEPESPDPVSTNDDSFEAVYQRFYRRVVYFFQLRRFSPEDVKELAQETFFRAYRKWDAFRGESSRETWLYEIASNLIKNRYRDQMALKNQHIDVSLSSDSETGEAAVPESALLDSSLPADQAAIAAESAAALRQAILLLPPQRRQCMELRLRDLEYHEIAQLMGVSIETVKSHLYQAREMLRKLLGSGQKS